MFGKLLSLHQQAISALLTNYLDRDSSFGVVHVVQDAIVTQSQFPTSDGIGPQDNNSATAKGWLVTQVNLDSVND
jgi:hypothetical protein